MIRILLGAAAAGFLAWEALAVALWLRSGGTIASAWRAAGSDWMILLFLTDGLLFAAAGLGAMAVDLRRTGASRGRIAAWLACGVLLGSPVLLFYLSRRRPPASHIQGGNPA